MPETPAAQAVDAAQAEASAQAANQAAVQAIANAADVAAAAEKAAAEDVAKTKGEVADALQNQESNLSWLKEHATATASHLENQGRELAALRTETGELKSTILTMAEAIGKLLTPKQPETPAGPEITPPEIPPKSAEDQPVLRMPAKRTIRKL